MSDRPDPISHTPPATQAGDLPEPLRPPGVSPAEARPGAAGEAERLHTGSGLGKYRILDRLRSSETATVYRARDILLDRLAVIKQLAPNLIDDPRACGRFRKEAYTLAQIGADCRQVVSLYELIEEKRGLFLVTEFVPGFSLETRISKRQLTLRNALELLARTCLGLRCIHAARVVHRDLAPRHIIIDVSMRPKITDFSLAAVDGADPDYTITSPAYTAPEVFLQQPYDDRADIYSLGVIAYEMLIGRPAFRRWANQTLGQPHDPLRWLAWHVGDEELPEAHRVDPRVPPMLSSIVARMVARSPDERFTTVDEIIALLVKHFSRGGRPAIDAAPEAPGRILPGPTMRAAPVTTAARLEPAPEPTWSPGAPGGGEDPAGTHTVFVRSNDRAGEAGAFRPYLRGRRNLEPLPTSLPILLPAREPSAGAAHSGRRRRMRRVARRGLAWTGTALIGAVVCFALYQAYIKILPSGAAVTERLLAEARQKYDAGEYAGAAEILKKASQVQVDGLEAYNAQADALRWLAVAEARAAISVGDFEAAEEHLRDARHRGMDRELVNPLLRDLIRAESGQRLRKQFGQTQPAEDASSNVENRGPAGPTSSAGVEVSDMATTERNYQNAIKHVRESIKRKDYDEAAEYLARAGLMKRTPEIEELSTTLIALRKHAATVALGDQAMHDGDYAEAVKEYRDAVATDASPEAQKKLNHALAMMLVAEGREAYQKGDPETAESKFSSAAWRDPDSPAAAELRRIAPAIKAAQIEHEGDEAATAENWATALEHYEKALAGLPPAGQKRVQAKIDDMRSRLSIAPQKP